MPQNGLFLREQLEIISNEVITQEFPELLIASGAILPVTNQLDYRAETFSWRYMTAVGEAKILSNGGQDVPLVSAYVQKKMGVIRTLVDGYEITLEDLEAAQFAGMNISAEMAIVARTVMEETIDRLGYTGSTEDNLLGFLNLPNVVNDTVLNDGNSNGGTNATQWQFKTADQIYRDITTFLTRARQATKSIEKPKVLLIPQAQFDRISELVFPANTDGTLLEFILKTQRATPSGLQDIVPVEQLAGAGVGGTDVMIAYQKDPKKIRFEVPLDFEQRPPEQVTFSTKVVCRSRLAGVILMKPMSLRTATGI